MSSPSQQQIEFLIHPDGTVEERVAGVTGPACEQVTEAIETALGEVTRREHTGDFFQGQEAGQVFANT